MYRLDPTTIQMLGMDAGMAWWQLTLASHQCGPGSITRFCVICELSLFVLCSAPGFFFLGTPLFPSPVKPTFDLR